jgi:lipoyl(octanoyl) transferase
MEAVTVYNLPDYQPYTKVLQLQNRLATLRRDGRIGNIILLLEHSPVISIGRTLGADVHLLAEPQFLHRQGIEVCVTNRGGDITYHGPGQLVVYFIITLPERDIRGFVRKLEQSVIALLAQYQIHGERDPANPGVWVQGEKICALGIYVRKWVTMHGIALNINPNLSHFDYIVPCGLHGKKVTSLQKICQAQEHEAVLNIGQIKQAYLASFAETFQAEIVRDDPQKVWQYLQASFNGTDQRG